MRSPGGCRPSGCDRSSSTDSLGLIEREIPGRVGGHPPLGARTTLRHAEDPSRRPVRAPVTAASSSSLNLWAMTHAELSLDQQQALRQAAAHLTEEFGASFGSET